MAQVNPTATSTGYTIGGASPNAVTTVIWGTDGLLSSPAPAGDYASTGYYIVESVDQETDSETIYIENGTGVKCARIIINNGQRWNLSVQDDTEITSPPKVGDTVGVVDGAGLISADKYAYSCVVVSSGERFTRKGVAMRNLTVEYLTLVDAPAT